MSFDGFLFDLIAAPAINGLVLVGSYLSGLIVQLGLSFDDVFGRLHWQINSVLSYLLGELL